MSNEKLLLIGFFLFSIFTKKKVPIIEEKVSGTKWKVCVIEEKVSVIKEMEVLKMTIQITNLLININTNSVEINIFYLLIFATFYNFSKKSMKRL